MAAAALSRRQAAYVLGNAEAGEDEVLQAVFRKMEGDGEVDSWGWTWELETQLRLSADGSAEFTTAFKSRANDEDWDSAAYVYHGRWARSSCPGSFAVTFDRISVTKNNGKTAVAAQAWLDVQVDEGNATLHVRKHVGMDKCWEAACPVGPFRGEWEVSQPHVPEELALFVHKELPTPVTLHHAAGVISCTNCAGNEVAIFHGANQLTLAEIRGRLAEKLCLRPASIKLISKHGHLLEGRSEGHDLVAALLEDSDGGSA
eukprot:TRINITY_DN107259_c0_g1_i1.p1 TRINITY_DN107259_c0_g1~~TRINITY_DN107259_c0_g1_i1.p1  ORF type:complete len:286 (+),score=48.76 TRINITY_DN107259_c0_g1_i1:84-860(+)